MEKEIKINVPSGYEIDKENSTFECIKFKPINKKLPESWEEFCINNNIKEGEYFIDNFSDISEVYLKNGANRDSDSDRNVLPSKELAKAMLALCQLIQLRDCYNDGWVPDWTKVDNKYIIYVTKNVLVENINTNVRRILAFKTEELRNEFINNFRDLIETAKPLL